MKTTSLVRSATAVGVAMGLMALPNVVAAQAGMPSAAAAIAEYARNMADSTANYPSDRYPNARGVEATLVQPDRYTEARVDSILDGLQELASNAPAARTRLRAAVALTNAGNRELGRGFAIVGRASAAYDAASRIGDDTVQGVILRMMSIQQEELGALSFLERVAREGEAPQAMRAFSSLDAMGSPGQEILRRLDETGGVVDPIARQALHEGIAHRTSPNQ